jgi:hypothetical protein
MSFDKEGTVVIRVRKAPDGQWNVSEAGLEPPFAVFETEGRALQYANELALTKGGSRVQFG